MANDKQEIVFKYVDKLTEKKKTVLAVWRPYTVISVLKDIITMTQETIKELSETPEATKEPTKQREGDQQLPTKNHHPFIQDLVIEDIEKRRQLGIQRYGTALQPFNGRNVLQDIYEEGMDFIMYLRQLLYEKENSNAKEVK